MQSVYAKESVTLTKNLGSDLLRQSHVMLNHENLRMLAIFHESLVSVRVWGGGLSAILLVVK